MKTNICQTCLSEDRQTTPVLELLNLLQEIDIYGMTDLNGSVCWECHKLIKKFARFKLQVSQAYEILKLKVKHEGSYSKLVKRNKFYYDYLFYHDLDPLVDVDKSDLDLIKEESVEDNREPCDDEDKSDHIPLKQEYMRNKIYNYVDDLKEQKQTDKTKSHVSFLAKTESISCDSGNSTGKAVTKVLERCNRDRKFNASLSSRKTKLTNLKKDEVTQKFTAKVFSVTEMLANREEKRNQPNFKKIPFKCDSCVLGFTKLEKLNNHIKKHHNEETGRYVCDVCLTRFPEKKPLEKHCKKHFTCYKCRMCRFETVDWQSAYSHCRKRHSSDTLNEIHCQQCPLVFRTPENLYDHMSKDHTLHCDECGKSFKGKNTLRAHIIRIHGSTRDFVCEICRKTFSTKSRLESHTSTHSAALTKRLAYCSLCRVQYKNLYMYRNHMRNSAAHSGYGYACPVCNKKFASKVYGKRHYNFYHLKKSQHVCEICNKLSISDWRLKNHRQKHHGMSRTRNHECNECGKQFYTLSTLRAHQLTHSEQRSYMCEDCGDTFKQRPALYTHCRLVHKAMKRKTQL